MEPESQLLVAWANSGGTMVDTVIVEAETSPVSAVAWPAVVAGGFVAGALTLLLLALGAGI
ncbi:MAG TPA: hypothetical protein VEP47_12175, partial [Reyranella sp.]|nr:hypothetical protein [Reyranella sp.]